ncbi:MAG: protein kinase, partial [Chloroflexi bacterium]|nr:protein kinase [Chloroflexota bacterium]
MPNVGDKILGRYQIIKELGSGGFGIVYLAYDEKLRRRVAIKVISAAKSPDPDVVLTALEKEAFTIAPLRHPNILKVFDWEVESEEKKGYLIMEYADGGTLEDVLKQRLGRRLKLDEAIYYFREIVQGVNNAHSNNVIHFDLKPQNVMFIEGRPVIGDFGLAQVINSTQTLDLNGIMGTPYYMAPELWEKKGKKASDVYSLGIILYQLLAGEHPFTGSVTQIMAQHLTKPLPILLTKNPNLPPGLQPFLENLTTKDPNTRPPTDKILELLDKALTLDANSNTAIYLDFGKSNLANPTQNLIARNPLQGQTPSPYTESSQVQASIPPVPIQTQGNFSSTTVPLLSRSPSQPPTTKPKIIVGRMGNFVSFGFIGLAVIFILLGLLILQPFGKSQTADTTTTLRSSTLTPTLYLNLQNSTPILTGHSYAVWTVAFSPDGKYLASGSYDKTVKLWDVNTAKELYTFKGHSDSITSVAFSPDGKYLASASQDKTIKVWDVSTTKELYTLKGHSYAVTSIAFSPDSKYLASASQDNNVKLWDVSTTKELYTLKGHSDSVWTVAFSPDGKYLASASQDKTVKLWDVNTARELNTFTGHASYVRSVAFSLDGKYLASGSDDNSLKVWDVSTTKELYTFTGHSNAVTSVAFSPDGKYLASASQDKTVK